jgi:hypothetical protein
LNQLAAPGARIYFVGYYSFWLRPDLLQCRQTREDERVLAGASTIGGKWASLFDRGFQYVVIDKATHRSAPGSFDKAHAPDWMEIENAWDDPLFLIYKMRTKDEQHRAKVGCRQISNPAWDVVEL